MNPNDLNKLFQDAFIMFKVRLRTFGNINHSITEGEVESLQLTFSTLIMSRQLLEQEKKKRGIE